MDATTDVRPDDVQVVEEEISVDIPQRGEFVPCDQCGVWSYMFYVINDVQLLSYCAHHGNHHHAAITEKYPGALFFDYSEDLKKLD